MNRADYFPEHDRTSCSDAEPSNAEATGSHGCARCTAILLDQRDEVIAAALTQIQEFKHRWMALPPFAEKVPRKVREGMTIAHMPIVELEQLLLARTFGVEERKP